MAKTKRQWRRFRVENRLIHGHKFYDLQVDISIHPEKGVWKTMETYDFFCGARHRAREMDKIMDGNGK